MAGVTDLYSTLHGQRVRQSERMTERVSEKTSKTREIVPVRYGIGVMILNQ